MKAPRGGKHVAGERGAFVRPEPKPEKSYPLVEALVRHLTKPKRKK
jgi:hypothetical protein